ncbi:MAG: hypothetical protein Q9163_003983 [Psora crenata]
MPKRKTLSTATAESAPVNASVPPPNLGLDEPKPQPPKRRASQRKAPQPTAASSNPNENRNILDAPEALRASPDADGNDAPINLGKAGIDVKMDVKEEDESSLSELSDTTEPPRPKRAPSRGKAAREVKKRVLSEESKRAVPCAKLKNGSIDVQTPQFLDPEAEGDEDADEEEIQAALSRPPPVNSDYLPLPWNGRLGYACLCTYLRFSNPPVFSSRTCRIASILENRHPLSKPNEPPHATKNRPDKEQPANIARGQAFVESLGKANARDIVKMLRWNDRYGIKFLRLSSEMFPFASHPEYGYKLAPFVSEELAEAGRVAAKLGHRLTTHPGQYTQLGSPRQPVIDNAIRDLNYHAELLDLLKLPPQQDRDAVMVLHLGGVFGDKQATLDRFRENYATLPENVKKRIVLENDDVSWSVHELLPLCEELNIPMVLDFHHHNIIFDASQIREGTKDIVDLFPRILATWKRKNITPKMHYSEPTPSAITARQRRKHSPRVATLPPCPPNMDLMIEAKDKEQAVFELMRTFKLPGYDTFNDMIPHVRKDDNKPVPMPKKKTQKKKAKKVKGEDNDLNEAEEANESAEDPVQRVLPEDEVGMGGPERRVYWPPGMEHWLRPVKKVIKPREPKSGIDADEKLAPAQKKEKAANASKEGANAEEEVYANGIKGEDEEEAALATPTPRSKRAKAPAKPRTEAATSRKGGQSAKRIDMPSMSDKDGKDEEVDPEQPLPKKAKVNSVAKTTAKRQSRRAKKINYAEDGEDG